MVFSPALFFVNSIFALGLVGSSHKGRCFDCQQRCTNRNGGVLVPDLYACAGSHNKGLGAFWNVLPSYLGSCSNGICV